MGHQETTKYLGISLTLNNGAEKELENRIASAWRKFHSYKQELTSRHYNLKDRLKLFNATVTPTILYGSASLTMTKHMETILTSTQRRMLRQIIQTPRRHTYSNRQPEDDNAPPTTSQQHKDQDHQEESSDDESTSNDAPCNIDGDIDNNDDEKSSQHEHENWVDWIRRATREAEAKMQQAGLESWTTMHRRRKWQWAHRIATQEQDRWTARIIRWQPQIHSKRLVKRKQSRLRRRWDVDIQQYLQTALGHNAEHWQHLAKNADAWYNLQKGYTQT